MRIRALRKSVLKKNMDIYKDALGLLKSPDVKFMEVPKSAPRPIAPARLPQAPENIRRREAKRQKTLAKLKAKEPGTKKTIHLALVFPRITTKAEPTVQLPASLVRR